jgi:hypothetical protein
MGAGPRLRSQVMGVTGCRRVTRRRGAPGTPIQRGRGWRRERLRAQLWVC